MHLAIISTTIQGEAGYLAFDVLASRSKFSKVTFIIAGDKGEKYFDTSKFKCEIEHLSPESQGKFFSSGVIPWKDPRRRPLAWLRAIELKPDYILTIDDDNIPHEDYFDTWYEVLSTPKNLEAFLKGDSEIPWLNYLRTSDAPLPTYPRGYPVPFRGRGGNIQIQKTSTPIPPERVGLFQGISLYDPDIDAMPKLVYEAPIRISKVEEKNYCLKGVWSPYNMQNTILTPRLFPLPILWPSSGRYDDIFASYTWQQLLFNNDMYVHIGDPFNTQDRGVRDTFNADFKLEIPGYTYAHEVWKEIKTITEKDGIIFLEKLMTLSHPEIQKERSFFEAYLKDIKKILS